MTRIGNGKRQWTPDVYILRHHVVPTICDTLDKIYIPRNLVSSCKALRRAQIMVRSIYQVSDHSHALADFSLSLFWTLYFSKFLP